MKTPLIVLLAIVLAACSGGGSSTSSSATSTDATSSLGTAVISDYFIDGDEITIAWDKSTGADADSWSIYHNDSAICNNELSVSSDDQQSGSCSFTLADGSNSIYVQLCSADTCTSSETLEIEHNLPPGAIYLDSLPNETGVKQLEVKWIKEQGANGDLWYIYHNTQSACSGSLTMPTEQQAQSAGCTIEFDFGEHQFQARLCVNKPTGTADICTDSPVHSLSSYFDPGLELATPVIEALDASLPAWETTINWSKDNQNGSAGESWIFYHNNSLACSGTLGANDSSGICSLELQEGSNSMYVQLCTEVETYSGAKCAESAIVEVEGTYPYALDPGEISLSTVFITHTYEQSLTIDWLINSGNGVTEWQVQLNDSTECLTSSSDYLSSGSCSVDLVLGANSISVIGCNYGMDGNSLCSQSPISSTERLQLPGVPEITSPTETSTYVAEQTLSWERSTGASAESWFASLNASDVDACRDSNMSAAEVQSGQCEITLTSGHNDLQVRLCSLDSVGASYCSYSSTHTIELLAATPGQAVISTESQTLYDDEITIEWSNSGITASSWFLTNNGSEANSCSADIQDTTSPQSGSCLVSLDLGDNLIAVTLCNSNAAGSQSCSTSETVTIDRQLDSPKFTSSSSIAVDEHSTGVIYIPEVQDNDSTAEQLSFVLLESDDHAAFSLDPSSGAITTLIDLDYESPQDSDQNNVYQLELEVYDDSAGSDSLSLQIAISNLNDNPPIFTNANPEPIPVAENTSADSTIYTASATDLDGDTLAYTLGGVDSAYFDLNPESAQLSFKQALDFEDPQDSNQDNTYELEISASDAATSVSLELNVSLSDSNDEFPQVPSSTASTAHKLSEISLETVIYTVEATDADANDILTYSLGGVDADQFNLDSTSGELRFTTLPSLSEPQDADQNNIYDLELSVSDAAANSTSLALAVTVADDIGSAPEFGAESASVEFADNKDDLLVYDAEATDPDGDSITYSLGGTDVNFFNIDAASGAVSFKAAPDYQEPLDSDKDNNYHLTIFARDTLGNQAQLELSVLVTSANPKPIFTNATPGTISIPENTSTDSIIYTASATDADDEALTYTLSGTDSIHFNLDSTTAQLSFQQAPDFEDPQDSNQDNTYELAISVTDNTHTISVDLNVSVSNVNEAHYFASTSSSLSLNENDTSSLALPAAVDPDASNAISYELIAITEDNNDYQYFNLTQPENSTAPSIAFADPAGADYENASDHNSDHTYEFILRASDIDYSASIDINISITNLNDNAPAFSNPNPETISVKENISTAATFYIAFANDADGDTIAYSLSSADSAYFDINPETGALSFKESPSFENPQDQNQDNTYDLEISVSDSTHSTSVDLSVEVSDVDEAPQFAQDAEAIEVPENTSTARIIYTAAAVDEDGDTITYALSGTDATHFILNSTTGALSFATSPDFENPQDQDGDNDYHIEIQATSSNNGVKSTASLQLSISVTDIDETPPYFTDADSVVTLVEDPETEGQQIAVLALEFAVYDDADDAAGRALSLELEGDDSSLFQISTSAANNHQVHFITSPDYDHTHDANQDCNYSFSVVATDSDGNEAKHSATIVITGVIDEAPYIDPASYTRGEIIAIAGNDTDPFLTLAGYDEDRSSWNYQTESWRYRDNFDTLSFTLTSTIAESDSDLFLLDPDTLELSLKASLNPENPQQRGGTDNLYQVEVAIIDSAGNSNLTDGSDTASRIVYVQVGEFVDKGSEPVDSGPQIPWFSSSEISLLSEKVDIAIPWVIHVGEGAISWEMYVNGTLECSYAVADLSSPVTSGHCMVAADKFKTYSTANNAWVIVCYLDNTCAQSETAIFGYAADVSYHPHYNFSYENPGTAADCGEVAIGDPVTHDNNTRCYNYLLETDSFGGKYYRSGLTYLDHDFGYNFDVVAYFIEWGVYARDFDPHDMPVDYLSTILYSFIKFEGDNTTANDECENCTFSGAVAIADTWAALDKPFYWPGAEEYYADQAETEEELAEVLAEKADMTGRGIFQQFWLLKQKFPRLQTCLSVGGWTFSRPFPLVASDPAKRAVFAESIVDMAVEYHFDCIDIDWEFPGKAGGDRVAIHDGVATYDLDGDGISPFVDPSPADADYFVALIAELRAEIDSRAEAKHIEINSAVYTSSEGMALMNYGAFADDLDGIHMMTYDYYGAWDPHTGLQAALYANTDPVSDDVALAYGNPYNPQHNIASAMARGVNNAINNGFRSELSVSEANSGIRQKIVPGLAFYGRNYSGVNMDEPVPGKYMVRATGTTGNSDGSAEQLGWEPGNLNYAQIEGYYNHGNSVKGNADYDAGGYSTADREWTYNWDDESQTPFLYDDDTASFVTYSDPRAIYYQTCHAAWHNSKGVMFWEISGDSEDFDLVAAIHAALSGEPLDDYRYNPQPSCTDLDTIDYGDIAYGPGAYADLSGIKDLQDLEDYGYISQEILDSLFFFNEEYHSDYLYGSIVNEECTDYNFLSDWEALKQTASEHFPKFASEGSIEDRLRELAAFFAFTAEYTMYGRDWGFYKLDPNKNVVYQDGYCHKEPPECADQSSCDQKCDADDEEYGYACSLGNSYHSRGHFHLSGSHNYGAMSEALFGDNDYTLLENPDLLATDVNLSWSSALWYWMNHEERELPYDDIPSPHNAIIGNFTAEPEWGRYPGLGFVTAVLSAYNGGDQCDEDSWRHGDSLKLLEPPAKHRLGFYLTYLNILSSNHVKYGYEPLSPWVTDTEGNTHGVYPATYAEFDLNEDDLIDRYNDVKKYLTCADMLAYD